MLSSAQLRALRVAMGWSLSQVAGVLHVSTRTVQRYEAGAPVPFSAGALLILVADIVRQTRARREGRAVAYFESRGVPADVTREALAMGLENVEKGIPGDWDPSGLAPCPVVLPVDLTPLISRRTVDS